MYSEFRNTTIATKFEFGILSDESMNVIDFAIKSTKYGDGGGNGGGGGSNGGGSGGGGGSNGGGSGGGGGGGGNGGGSK